MKNKLDWSGVEKHQFDTLNNKRDELALAVIAMQLFAKHEVPNFVRDTNLRHFIFGSSLKLQSKIGYENLTSVAKNTLFFHSLIITGVVIVSYIIHKESLIHQFLLILTSVLTIVFSTWLIRGEKPKNVIFTEQSIDEDLLFCEFVAAHKLLAYVSVSDEEKTTCNGIITAIKRSLSNWAKQMKDGVGDPEKVAELRTRMDAVVDWAIDLGIFPVNQNMGRDRAKVATALKAEAFGTPEKK